MTLVGLERGDLVLCSGTLPQAVSFRDRVDAAVAADFPGISMWGRDYARARSDGHSDGDIRSILDDAGLAVAEVDPAWWWLPGAAAIGASIVEHDPMDVFRFDEQELLRIAEVIGARSLNAADVFGGEWSVDDATEAFATLCDRAAEHGLLVHVEFLPWSKIPDLATAVAIARGADRPNGGITVDAWHLTRSGGQVDDLLSVPGDLVLGVQLDDGPAAPEEDLMNATLHERRLPGDGDFDLARFVGALDTIGANAPYGVEVFSDDLYELAPREIAARAADSMRRVLAAAR
jgi:sugar phosphate isomerase/epimerase